MTVGDAIPPDCEICGAEDTVVAQTIPVLACPTCRSRAEQWRAQWGAAVLLCNMRNVELAASRAEVERLRATLNHHIAKHPGEFGACAWQPCLRDRRALADTREPVEKKKR
jgi:hypothetical protein